jgi:hypothetical protein
VQIHIFLEILFTELEIVRLSLACEPEIAHLEDEYQL